MRGDRADLTDRAKRLLADELFTGTLDAIEADIIKEMKQLELKEVDNEYKAVQLVRELQAACKQRTILVRRIGNAKALSHISAVEK